MITDVVVFKHYNTENKDKTLQILVAFGTSLLYCVGDKSPKALVISCFVLT